MEGKEGRLSVYEEIVAFLKEGGGKADHFEWMEKLEQEYGEGLGQELALGAVMALPSRMSELFPELSDEEDEVENALEETAEGLDEWMATNARLLRTSINGGMSEVGENFRVLMERCQKRYGDELGWLYAFEMVMGLPEREPLLFPEFDGEDEE